MGGDGAPPAAAAEEYAAAKTSVWWDIENCQVPRSCDPQLIAQNISSALSTMGYKGPVSISSYGDTGKVSSAVMNALHSTGIGLIHVPAGAKDASDKKILADMIFWAVDNPPPANYLLISGDRDFSYALHQLRMRRYNILLAQPPCVSSTLVAAAKSVWNWKDLVAGGSPLLAPYAGSSTNSKLQSIETSKEIVPTTGHMESSLNPNNQKFSSNEKPDNQQKWKPVYRPPNEGPVFGNTPTTSINESKQPPTEIQGLAADSITSLSNHRIEQKNQVTVASTSEQESTDSKSKQNYVTPLVSPIKRSAESSNPHQTETMAFKGAPHELFRAHKPETSSSTMPSKSTPLDDIKRKGKPSPKNHNQQNQSPRVGNLVPPHKSHPQQGKRSLYSPQNRPNGSNLTSSQSWPNSQPYSNSSPNSAPDIGKTNISVYPNTSQRPHNPRNDRSLHLGHNVASHTRQNLYQNYKHRPPPPNADSFPGNEHSTEVQNFIGTILSALSILKIDKMAPTEANLTDCIRYGEINKRNLNVKMALDYAIQHQAVVMHKLGNNLPFYIGKSDSLWKCVNPVDINCKHPKAIWDEIIKFFDSPNGCSSIMISECRYHAATFLKQMCLQNLVMGEILQILHVLINNKKWIVTGPSGWQPIRFNLPNECKDANAATVNTPGSNPSS